MRAAAWLLGTVWLAAAAAGPTAARAADPAAGETAGAGVAAASDAPVLTPDDLLGTWYVLAHYQDAESSKPDAWRWEDRVWRFERQGDRLTWTEWPIVVFDDESGRFENLGTNRQARVVAAWEPNADQLADIENGLQVNPRGSKTKTLRSGDEGRSWSSAEAAPMESASIVTYSEHWSVQGLPGPPLFLREDSLGSARSESMQGRTEYRTEQVIDGGRELRGHFERDGTRVGNFRMIRSGETERVRGSGLTQGQRLMRMFASQVGLSLGDAQLEALRSGHLEPGTEVPEAVRADLRAKIRQSVEEAYRKQGQDPRRFAGQVDSLTRKIEHLLVDEGKSVEEVQRMLEAGDILP